MKSVVNVAIVRIVVATFKGANAKCCKYYNYERPFYGGGGTKVVPISQSLHPVQPFCVGDGGDDINRFCVANVVTVVNAVIPREASH